MTHFDYDLHPVSRIIADAVGEPGNRTFYLQARQGTKLVSLIMEKQQVSALATSILQLLEELEEQNPDLSRARSQAGLRSLEMPLNPAFRVSQLGLGYDEDEDLVVIVAQSFSSQPVNEGDDDLSASVEGGWDEGEPEDFGPESDPEGEPGSEPAGEALLARFYATRNQMRTLSEHALQVVQAGRPDCPLCGRPIDPHGHFCPRTDGHAFPLMV